MAYLTIYVLAQIFPKVRKKISENNYSRLNLLVVKHFSKPAELIKTDITIESKLSTICV